MFEDVSKFVTLVFAGLEGSQFEYNGIQWQRRLFGRARLRGARTMDGRFQVVEQSPRHKESAWGAFVRAGHQVVWGFDRTKVGSPHVIVAVDGVGFVI